jgi:hypothetical protein
MPVKVVSRLLSAVAIAGFFAAIVAGRLHFAFYYVIWVVAFLALVASLLLAKRDPRNS